MFKNLSTKNYWENIYSKRRNSKIYPSPRKYRSHFELDRLFRKYLPKQKGLKIIEMGCGGSSWLPYFCKEFGYQVYGVDYSYEGCESAMVNLEEAGGKGEIFCEDFFDLGEKFRGQFDIIVSFGVIEHFNDPLVVLNLTNNLLKERGVLITVAPNTESTIFKAQKFIDKNVYNIHKIFSLEDLSNYHKDAGMQVILERYLQFIDLAVLNYQSVLKGNSYKWIARGITVMNLPILYLQKAFRFFPQNGRWCSSMVVMARKETFPSA